MASVTTMEAVVRWKKKQQQTKQNITCEVTNKGHKMNKNSGLATQILTVLTGAMHTQ